MTRANMSLQSPQYRCRVQIRLAEPADFPALVIFGRNFYEQTAYQSVPYSEAGAAEWYGLMLKGGLLFVAVDGEKLVGVIGGLSCPFIMNPAYGVGTELLWWVEPEYRRSGAGDLLMDAIEQAARDQGLTFWSMMSLEAVRPEAAARIYERRGYKLAEHTYVKEL